MHTTELMTATHSFVFRVREAFTLADRGTVALGRIESGSVRTGDRVRLERDPEVRARCEGISEVRDTEPAVVGLLLPSLAATDLRRDDLLVADEQSPHP